MKKLKLETRKCLQCRKIIQLKIRRDLWRKKFCSRRCSTRYQWKTGKCKSPWLDKKLSKRMRALMRKPKTLTEKLRKAQKERGLRRRKPWRWYVENGKKIKFHQSQDWRDKAKEIYKRDNYTCQECGKDANQLRKMGLKLHCHHKEGIKTGKKLFDNNNLITLCEECHSREHPELHFVKKR